MALLKIKLSSWDRMVGSKIILLSAGPASRICVHGYGRLKETVCQNRLDGRASHVYRFQLDGAKIMQACAIIHIQFGHGN
jgi:hypothetical protein